MIYKFCQIVLTVKDDTRSTFVSKIIIDASDCHSFNNLHENIKFTMQEESNREAAFCDTLLGQNNEKISALVYRKPTHTDQYLHYSSYHQTSCKESVVSYLFNSIFHYHQ